MIRRRFLTLLAAPAVITTAGLLMPVRKILWTPMAEPTAWPKPYDGPIRIVAVSGECVATSSDIWFANNTGLWRVTFVGDAYQYVPIQA